MERGKDEEGRVKKFHFSRAKGVVLESENIFFLEMKEDDPGFLGEEDKRLLSYGAVFYGGGMTKVRGLNLRMEGTFS